MPAARGMAEVRPNTSHLQVHVNVSGAQLLQQDFVERVFDIVHRSHVRPDQVALEVTESMLIDRLSVALPNLRRLREGGMEITSTISAPATRRSRACGSFRSARSRSTARSSRA